MLHTRVLARPHQAGCTRRATSGRKIAAAVAWPVSIRPTFAAGAAERWRWTVWSKIKTLPRTVHQYWCGAMARVGRECVRVLCLPARRVGRLCSVRCAREKGKSPARLSRSKLRPRAIATGRELSVKRPGRANRQDGATTAERCLIFIVRKRLSHWTACVTVMIATNGSKFSSTQS